MPILNALQLGFHLLAESPDFFALDTVDLHPCGEKCDQHGCEDTHSANEPDDVLFNVSLQFDVFSLGYNSVC